MNLTLYLRMGTLITAQHLSAMIFAIHTQFWKPCQIKIDLGIWVGSRYSSFCVKNVVRPKQIFVSSPTGYFISTKGVANKHLQCFPFSYPREGMKIPPWWLVPFQKVHLALNWKTKTRGGAINFELAPYSYILCYIQVVNNQMMSWTKVNHDCCQVLPLTCTFPTSSSFNECELNVLSFAY